MTAKSKVLAYLSKTGSYNTLTSAKMQSAFGVKNPTAMVDTLRKEGHAIYRNTRTTASGEKVSYYRLGTPTKRMIAAGIIALRQHGFSTFA
jgi:predicted transcriptional regulator